MAMTQSTGVMVMLMKQLVQPNNLGLENIVVAVNPKNPGSEKILLKIGLLFDGNIDWPNQGLVNKYTLSIEQFFNSITNI